MRLYELMYIVRPDLDDEEVNQAAEKVNGFITHGGGEVVKQSHWGKRKLAYEVDKMREGYYVLTNFNMDPTAISELERQLRISDTVFRYLLVRPDEDIDLTPEQEATAAPSAEAAPATAPETEVQPEPVAAGITEVEAPVGAQEES
ncbi:MAG: 30S ribosomal protein S6 [Candidatus Dormibacteria bacterium]